MLLVLRSLAVYGATAAALLYAAHRWVRPIRPAAALALALAPLLFTGRATFRGEVYAPLDIQAWGEPFASLSPGVRPAPPHTPLLSDVVESMIPWQKAVRESVKHGRLPLWNRFVLSGEPLLAVQQAGVLHPFTWAGFLLPLGPAWTFQMSARFLLALLSGYLLMRELGCRDAAALLGAAAWAFSDFFVFWIGYSVGGALAPLPLLLVGLSRLARDGDGRAIGLTVVALVLIVVAGHPESLLFAVAGAGVWFLFELVFAGRGRRLRAVGLSLVAGALALGLTAVQLLPLAEIVPKTWEHAVRSDVFAHAKRSVPVVESVRHLTTDAVPFAYGEAGFGHGQVRPGFEVPAGYAGAILLPLALTGLGAGDRRRWTLLTLAILGSLTGARLAGLTDGLTRLPLFDISVTEYLVFLVPLAVGALAALGAERLTRGEGRELFLASSGLVLAGVVAILLYRSLGLGQLGMSDDYQRRRVLLELVPLMAAVVLVTLTPRRRTSSVAIGFLALLLVPRFLEAGALYPSCPESMLAPRIPGLDVIPRGKPVRVVAVGYRFVPNVSALYELEDVRGYESLTLRSYVATYPTWCVPVGAWFNRVDDLERPFLSFLNVGFALVPAGFAPPRGWTLAARDPSGDVLRNERSLPRVFVPGRLHTAPDLPQRLALLAAIPDFSAEGVIGPGADVPAGGKENGRGSADIVEYRGSSIAVRVTAGQDAVVATSIPAWPGWQATLDGRALEPLEYNVAFLAYRLPAGEHRLSIRYRPAGVVRGGILSAFTLAALAATAVVRRRRAPLPASTSPARSRS